MDSAVWQIEHAVVNLSLSRRFEIGLTPSPKHHRQSGKPTAQCCLLHNLPRDASAGLRSIEKPTVATNGRLLSRSCGRTVIQNRRPDTPARSHPQHHPHTIAVILNRFAHTPNPVPIATTREQCNDPADRTRGLDQNATILSCFGWGNPKQIGQFASLIPATPHRVLSLASAQSWPNCQTPVF